ncbi:MAG: nucleoside-diphosphate sugar epimerase/dehydratase [Gemmatimonadales bacterium]|jgi:FlaA1/EpsC-like NDP-sugar epimerase
MIEIPPKLIRIGERLYNAAYAWRRTVAYTLYLAVVVFSYAAAFLLRFDFAWRPAYGTVFALSLLPLLAIRYGFAVWFRLSTGRWRFIGSRDVLRLAVATTAGSAVFGLLVWLLPFSPRVPRAVVVMEWVFTTTFTAALWTFYRTLYEQVRHHLSGFNGSAKRVLIIGAGEAGNLLVREMLRYPTGYRPIGFVDDDSKKWGMVLRGVEVIGATKDLVAIAKAERAHEIIIAVPSGPSSEMRRIVESCESTQLPFKVLPGIAQVLAGDVRVNQLRDVRIEDLLGREPVQLTLPELAADLRGRRVLITGAAGSIGSELARQVALHGPGTLVLFDQAETDLFYIGMELREKHPDLVLVQVIGDIVDPAAVERVFREHQPERVYHAAAYKHVPMMERNQREAIRNNVIGTWRVADAAGRYRTDKFVLVSTDKAVEPVSVMGATKRLAELVVLELQERHQGTTYAAVRFGNVLGSNGSVLPIFKRQLESGKPLTVTDPEATRYFMTIQEAVQLILQASLLPEVRGSIAMLEMGEPVRIEDLARNLLHLAGLDNADGGRIVYTGLRPGERLHEHLLAPDEQTHPTAIPRVRLVLTNGDSCGDVCQGLGEWEQALRSGGDNKVLASLKALFPGLDSSYPAAGEVQQPLFVQDTATGT